MAQTNPNPWQMKYRFVIFAVSAAHAGLGAIGAPDGAGDSNILTVGYDPGGADNADQNVDILSLNKAISMALSFVRRYQSTGRDVVAHVFGQPHGQNDVNTAYKLEGQGTGLPDSPVVNLPKQDMEKHYAVLDSPSPYLKLRMSLASKSQTDALFTGTHKPDLNSEG